MNKNKIGSILAASAILCATTTVTAHAQEVDKDNNTTLAIEGRSQNSTAVVINCPEGLNLRKGPSTNDSILRLLPNGAKLDVLSSSNGWTKVKYDGIYGYVYSTYIKINNTQAETSMTSTGKVVNTGGATLNLRSSASTSSTVIAKISAGTKLTITAKNGAWYKVSYGGKTGYVHSDYIEIVQSNNSQNSGSATTETTMKSTGKVANTGGATLNLRSSASTSSTVLAKISEGTKVTITAKNGDWYKVSYGGKTGYVHSNYIELIKEDSSSNSNTNTGNGDVAFSSAGYVGDTDKLGLFMRTSPSSNGSIMLTIPEGATLTVIAKNGDWYKVSYGGKTGYAHASYIILGNKPSNNTGNGDTSFSSTGYVGDTENLGLLMRTGPSTNSSIILTIPQGAVVTVVAKDGAWYKVTYGGKTGYAHSEYIVLGEKPSNSNATFESVYNVMKAHIGTPYVWGGSGEYITDSSIATLKARFPYEAADGWYNYIGRDYYNKGYRAFDCSGLMQWGFAQVGISIGRTTYTQVNAGVGVSVANAQPGDLLITKDQGHVGMYIGNGQWIESPAPGYSIRTSYVNWNNIGYVRRVL